MATNVILPALGISQDTGKILRWLRAEGQAVTQGEPLLEIETDKAAVELEAPASGILANISANKGDEAPVGQVIAVILAPGEPAPRPQPTHGAKRASATPVSATPVATRMAQQHGIDLRLVKPHGGRIDKSDVSAYLESQKVAPTPTLTRRIAASPKARRLAVERGINLASLHGSGPGGVIQAADVPPAPLPSFVSPARGAEAGISTTWRIMAERITQCWTTVPHFYLLREANASELIAWREKALKRSKAKITYTDLLIKIVAAALRKYPRVNAMWREGKIALNTQVNVGIAVAVDEGLVVPVIHDADTLSMNEIAVRRQDLVTRAQATRLSLDDLAGGTFTISNLGMYGIDAFSAIINPPQAAILAVGRITERVVPVNGQPGVQPMLVLSLSCDHRVVDGARGAEFLQTVAEWIEEPLALL